MFFLVVVVLFVQMPSTHSVSYCRFYKDRQPAIFIRRCSEICCQNIAFPRENQTCCRMNISTTFVTYTVTYFGYKWWTILLFTICSLTALALLVHLYKRFYMVKRITVNPSSAFTISKDVAEQNNNSEGHGRAVIVEDNPPSYASADRPATPAPPAYVTINAAALA